MSHPIRSTFPQYPIHHGYVSQLHNYPPTTPPPIHDYLHHPWIYEYPIQGLPRHSFALQRGLSEVLHGRDKFMVKVDVHEFSPDELLVKTKDEFLLIEGHHEEKADEHGYITRTFKRKFCIPPDVDTEEVECEITLDGLLKVTIPKKQLPAVGEKVHQIKKP